MNSFTQPSRTHSAAASTDEKNGFDPVANLVADLLDGVTLPSAQPAKHNHSAPPERNEVGLNGATATPITPASNGLHSSAKAHSPLPSAPVSPIIPINTTVAPATPAATSLRNGDADHLKTPPERLPPWELPSAGDRFRQNQVVKSLADGHTPAPLGGSASTAPEKQATSAPSETISYNYPAQSPLPQASLPQSSLPQLPLSLPNESQEKKTASVPAQSFVKAPSNDFTGSTVEQICSAPFSSSQELRPSEPPVASAATFAADVHAINIKGRADGVVIEIGKGNWDVLLAALAQRLAQSGSFFRGGNVALDMADRSLGEADLRAVCDILVQHGLKPALVRTAADRTYQSALALGLASSLETKDGAPVETILPAASNGENTTHYVYRGALRSGQVLKRRSHILIIGDVNPGSEVVATGDILIWGRLRGAAHAGSEGDSRAIIAAFDIDPVQLRIAECVAVGSNAPAESGYRWLWTRTQEKRPEVARLINGQIVIEPWDEARTGGSPVLKKKR